MIVEIFIFFVVAIEEGSDFDSAVLNGPGEVTFFMYWVIAVIGVIPSPGAGVIGGEG